VDATSRILVLSDMTEVSDVAVMRGLQLAAAHGAEVHVLFVEEELPEPFFDLMDPVRKRAEQKYQEWLDREGDAYGVTVHWSVRSGNAAVEALEYADDLGVALKIIDGEAYQHRDWTDRLQGTVASRVIRKGHRPTLVTRGDNLQPYRRALALTDLSEISAGAFKALCAWTPDDLETHVLYAIEVPSLPLPGDLAEAGTIDIKSVIDDYRRQGETELQEFLGALDFGARRVDSVVDVGSPVALALEQAESHHVDLIGLGTRGRGRLTSFLLGSVAEALLHHADVDLLVTPPHG